MEAANTKYAERLDRLTKAITLDKPDRTPAMMMADTFCANYQGVKMSKFSTKPLYSVKILLDTYLDFPMLDAVEIAYAVPYITANAFLTKVKVAGRDLPEGTAWQIDEREYMKEEDYDYIIDKGYGAFLKMANKNRLGFSQLELLKTLPALILGPQKFQKAGIPTFATAFTQIPLETFASGRSVSRFMTDLFRIPDKVQAAMDVAMEFLIEDVKKQIKRNKAFTVFMFNARGSNHFISPKMFEKYTWPYLEKLTNAVIEGGAYPNLHCDGNWENALEYFKGLPKGKCIFAADSSTNMEKIRKHLHGHMCIKGDVSPTVLTMGTPDEVYNYSANLIKEMDGTGFILSPGCTLPVNAKPDNVKAMLAAIA